MKRFRVVVEQYQYYGVYVEANSEEEAERIVDEMIGDGELPDCAVDDGDGDVRLVEGETYEVDENDCIKMTW